MLKPKFRLFSAKLIILFGCSLLILISCKHNEIPANTLPTVPFSKIKVIYSSYCATCHNGTGELRYNFNDSIDIRNSVVPFNVSKSKSYESMISTFQIMPPIGAMPLPTNLRTLVRVWIEQGAKPTD